MRQDSPSFTAVIVAFAVVILGGDEYGRQRLPPGSIVQIQKDLLATVMAIRRPYLHPTPPVAQTTTTTKSYEFSRWYWYCWWLLWCNPCFAKLVRWYLQCCCSLLVPGNRRNPDQPTQGRRRDSVRVIETIGYRKTFMENCVRQGIERGNGMPSCQQVLMVGGGFDTLAWRLSELYPHIQFWEVDHPNTGRLKQQAIQSWLKGQHKERSNLHLVSVDLATTCLDSEILSSSETRHPFDLNSPTVVIVEGLLMYLTEQQVVDLLQHQLADLVGPQSILAFDFVVADDSDVLDQNSTNPTNTPSKSTLGSFFTPIVHWLLQHILHEPWLWGVSPKHLPKFVEQKLSKWTLCTTIITNNEPHKSSDTAIAKEPLICPAGVVYITKMLKR